MMTINHLKNLFVKIILSYCFFIGSFSVETITAQSESSYYRSAQNPYYWGNRKPYDSYWQQDVHYVIKAIIDEKTDILNGNEILTYWNNSPDELNVVYFHLYQNMYQPGSYYDKLAKANGSTIQYGKYQKQKLNIVVERMSVNEDTLQTELDNTILKVFLKKPLKSGESMTFNILFKTYFDIEGSWSRMMVYDAWGDKHYNGGHWYPRIAVYDRKFGWATDQHLGHEFYGDYGTYDVELTFANNFIVDATGILINQKEVLPEELRKELDIKNFKNKKLNEKPSIVIPYDSTIHKTWKFHAENVHDFAFLADPTFRIGEIKWNGISCIALAQEPHAAGWQDATEATAAVIQLLSRDFGKYAYPKIIASDARSGMEYPMLTMDGGISPDYYYVIAHEVGHNWFFGMVGNNETYCAALDEGFTQFLTIWALSRVTTYKVQPHHFYNKYGKDFPFWYLYAYLPYVENATQTEGVQLNTHSDMFASKSLYDAVYRQVYYKTSVMLYNLQYVLGDDLFQKAMKHYVEQWKFCHPYLEDFRNSVIQYTHVDLNWFFDQWLETTKTTDYAVKSVKKKSSEGDYVITFKRKGQMQMPIDFAVKTRKGELLKYHIPNNWFIKNTNATVLPKWYGWGSLNKTYEATVHVPGKVKNVIIDPSLRLADVNMLNNTKKIPINITYDNYIKNTPDWTRYELFVRPDAWWNAFDGVKAGVHISSSYMNYKHKAELTLLYNTGWLQGDFNKITKSNSYDLLSYILSYSTPLEGISKNLNISLSAKHLDGFNNLFAGLDQYNKQKNIRYFFNVQSMFRKDSVALNYLLYPHEWGISPNQDRIKFNNTLTVGMDWNYSIVHLKGNLNVTLRSSALGSDYNYAAASLCMINKNPIWKFKLNTRLFAQRAFGKSMPDESALYLAGANPEAMMDNAFTRSVGFVPNKWLGYGVTTNHFQMGGGLNIRGYAGYLTAYKNKKGEIVQIYKGSSGAAFNAELEFDNLFEMNSPWLGKYFKLNTYLFGDIGVINANPIEKDLVLADIRTDAGIGAAFTIKQWGRLQTWKPVTIRFDVPLFLNHPPAVEPDFIKYRWIVSINRAF